MLNKAIIISVYYKSFAWEMFFLYSFWWNSFLHGLNSTWINHGVKGFYVHPKNAIIILNTRYFILLDITYGLYFWSVEVLRLYFSPQVKTTCYWTYHVAKLLPIGKYFQFFIGSNFKAIYLIIKHENVTTSGYYKNFYSSKYIQIRSVLHIYTRKRGEKIAFLLTDKMFLI